MLGACKKSDDAPKDDCTTITSYTGTETYTFQGANESETYQSPVTYDAQGRVTFIDTYSGYLTLSYAYNGPIITETVNEGGFLRITNYTLDNNNRIVSQAEGDDITTFIYDGQGYLLESQQSGYTVKYKWQNGNLIETEGFNSGISAGNKATYSYYDDTAPDTYQIVLDELYKYKGRLSRNLLKEVVRGSNKETYAYEKDSNGRVSKVVMTDFGYTYTYDLNYSCK